MERLSEITNRVEGALAARGAVVWTLSAHVADRDRAGRLLHFERAAGKRYLECVKAAVTGSGIVDGQFGAGTPTELAQGFLGAVARTSVLDRLIGAGAQVADPNRKTPVLLSDPTSAWVPAGSQKPVSAMGFTRADLAPKKNSTLIVITDEVSRSTNAATLDGLTRRLAAAVARGVDTALLDATAASTARPAGLRNGVSAITTTGTVQGDLGALLAALGDAVFPVLITSWSRAATLVHLAADLAALGVPIITTAAAAGVLLAVDAAGVVIADDGIMLDTARQGSITMDDAGGATPVLSLFQANAVALRAERYATWAARAGAVQWIA